MRLLFISDIHGISKNLNYIKEQFVNLKCDKLIVLGDILNGPTYLDYYNPLDVIDFLNSFQNQIICLKGNCDNLMGLEQLSFEIYDNVYKIKVDDYDFYLTHGNKYNYNNLGNIKNGILIYGHEHKPYIRNKVDVLCINPGSISIPRGHFKESYLYYDNGEFTIYDVDNQIIDKYNLK